MNARAKQRIKAHAEHWEIERKSVPVVLGIPATLFKCPEPCGWFGWIADEHLKEAGINV